MLDIRLIREQPDLVKAALGRTGVDPAQVDAVLAYDEQRRALLRCVRWNNSKRCGMQSRKRSAK